MESDIPRFWILWNLPFVIGVSDGKHIGIKYLKNLGTLHHSYKCFFSLVLLSVWDAGRCFTLRDVGQCGGSNESGVLRKSPIGECFSCKLLQNWTLATVPGCEYDPPPYIFVGNEIFPLKTFFMRYFPGKTNEEQQIYNYRLSRACRLIENWLHVGALSPNQ